MNHAVRPIFPKSSITSVSPQDMSKEYNRATLVDSAINIVSEMPDGDILGAEAVKAIISGETVQARQIREAPFDLNCKAGHLFAANDLPALRDFSTGFQRRWRIITWPNQFLEDNPKRRTDWPELLAGERSTIASWYVRCTAAALHRTRYTPVSSSDAEVWRWVNEADSVAVWVEARCTRSSASTQSTKLYADYRNWVGSVGMRPVTIQKFGRRLTRLGVPSIHTKYGEAKGLLIQHEPP
jgi:putative DNA primase/helicase